MRRPASLIASLVGAVVATTAAGTVGTAAGSTPTPAGSTLTAAGSTPTPADSTPTVAGSSSPALTLRQEFNVPFVDNLSPDGKLRINGDWPGTGGNTILRANSRIANGRLVFGANATSSAEVQTIPERLYGAGCYATRLKTARPPGVVTSFFWIGDGYTMPEVDIEFLSKDRRATSGKVWLTVHLAGAEARTSVVPLAFDPSAAFHTYTFAFTSTSVTWYVDGRRVKRLTGLPAGLGSGRPLKGYVMANAWSGAYEWVGPPPSRDTFAAYDWMRGWEGASACPS